MASPLRHLLSPIKLGHTTAKNRIVSTPHGAAYGERGGLTDRYIRYHEEKAKGGCDGCDIPFYGGHLLESFNSPLPNTRTDEDGGSIENRTRLGQEVLRAVREAVGKDFIIGVRHSGDHIVPGGLTKEELLQVARIIDGLGIADYWMVSGSNSETLRFEAMVTPSLYHPHALYADLAAATRSVGKVPVILAGRVSTPEQAERVLASGICDLVGMTRAMIADPEMPKKAMEGRLDDIRTCVGASEGCIGRLRQGKAITCVQNPMIGREAELGVITPATRARRVLVIGGGVGGLETARVAALRGHTVTLLEAAPALGGQVLVAARAPKREDYAAIAHWLVGQVRKAGVEVRLNAPADEADVR